MFEIEEGKTASKSSDTSDTAIVTFYAIGVVAAVGVAEMIIRNRMDKSNWILKSCSLRMIFCDFSKTFYSFDEFIKNVMAFTIFLKNFGS